MGGPEHPTRWSPRGLLLNPEDKEELTLPGTCQTAPPPRFLIKALPPGNPPGPRNPCTLPISLSPHQALVPSAQGPGILAEARSSRLF